jgi:hypothetical protein
VLAWKAPPDTLHLVEKSPRPDQLESLVREITRELLDLAVTPHVRELRAKAVTYGRAISNWTVYTPTPPQVQAMVECINELQAKVAEAKSDANPDVSKVTKRRSAPAEPVKPGGGGSLLPSAIPPAFGWNAVTAEASGIRSRSSRPVPSKAEKSSASDAPTKPPPAASGVPPARSGPPQPTTAPPVSAKRPTDDEHPTPIPALLRSRRSR